jgi:hypothetical protein
MEGARVVEPQDMQALAEENKELERKLAEVNILVEDGSTTRDENPYQSWHNKEYAQLVNANLKHSLNGMIYSLFGQLKNKDGGPLQIRWINAYFPWTSPSYEVEVLFDGKWLEILGCGVVQQAALTRSSEISDSSSSLFIWPFLIAYTLFCRRTCRPNRLGIRTWAGTNCNGPISNPRHSAVLVARYSLFETVQGGNYLQL